ncbi:hypothetical protein Tco_0592628 [Tanacetum coccineum]
MKEGIVNVKLFNDLVVVGIGGRVVDSEGWLDEVAGKLVGDGVVVVVGVEVGILGIGKVGWFMDSVGEECGLLVGCDSECAKGNSVNEYPTGTVGIDLYAILSGL